MADFAAKPERSVVTILVVDTVGSTDHIASIDPDDAQALLDGIYMHIRRTIERAGGLLVSFAGDGGVAVFGWPGSQEDHADRACAAAWEIQHPTTSTDKLIAPNGNPIQFRIGIHSGLVGLRQLHLEAGAILDLVGGTVHLAAALEKRAPKGGVLISSKTVNLCRSQLQLMDVDRFPTLEKLGASPHHMIARPHRMSATDLTARYQRPMVGRGEELEQLVALLPRKGQPNKCAAIIGDPGLGKSHMVTSLIREARNQPQSIEVLLHGGESGKRSTPFSTMRPLLAQALEIDVRAPLEALQSALLFKGLVLTPDEMTMLGDFWTLGNEKDLPSPIQLRSVLTRIFLQAAVQRPVMVVIDDLHHVDPETLRCLEDVTQAKTDYSILLLLAGRRTGLPQAEKLAETVFLMKPLRTKAMVEIARQFPGTEALDDDLITLAARRADGIPFVLEQILSSIAELGDEAVMALPQSVESLIHARLNQLTDSSKAVAQALSVLGESVELEMARETLTVSAAELQENLLELERFELIHPPLGSRVQFRHALLADACANTVGRGRRRGLHERAMEAIHALHPSLDGQYERLAHHAEQAGKDALALDHLWNAARLASRTWSTGSLQLLFERALPLIERLGVNAERYYVDFVLLTYTPSLQLGEFTRYNQHLPRALEIAERLKIPAKICGVQCQMAIIAWFDGRYEDGLPIAQAATELAEGLASPSLIFSAKILLSSIYHGQARLEDAIRVQRELVELLSGDLRLKKLGSAGVPSALANGYLSWYMMEVGRYDEGLPFAETSVAIADEANDSYSRVLARLGLGRNLLMLERNDGAVAELKVAHSLAIENGFQPASVHIGGLLASALTRTSQAQAGFAVYEKMLNEQLDYNCSELERFNLFCGGAEALHAIDQHEEAMATCGRALDAALAINNQCLISQALGLRARLRFSLDEECPLGSKDIEHQSALCREYGLAAWQPKANNSAIQRDDVQLSVR